MHSTPEEQASITPNEAWPRVRPAREAYATFFAEKSPADPILPRRGKELAVGLLGGQAV
jgi:hypothetical protein